MGRVSRLCFGIFAVFITAMPPCAHAADWSVWGGKVLEGDQSAVRASVGWATEVSFHLPIQKRLEIAPKFGVFFGSPVMTLDSLEVLRNDQGDYMPGNYVFSQCCGIGNVFGAEVRYALIQKSSFHLSARAEVGGLLSYPSGDTGTQGVSPGARISVGTAIDYSAYYEVNLFAGVDLSTDVYFTPFVSIIPVLFRAGIEYMMSESTALFAMSRFGPGFTVFGPGIVDVAFSTSAGFAVDGLFGVAYRFGAPEDYRFARDVESIVPTGPDGDTL